MDQIIGLDRQGRQQGEKGSGLEETLKLYPIETKSRGSIPTYVAGVRYTWERHAISETHTGE